MKEDKTDVFDLTLIKKKQTEEMLKEVTKSLEKRGYDPINQIVGYLISGDPGYISNYQSARDKISKFDRTEIVALVLEEYLKK